MAPSIASLAPRGACRIFIRLPTRHAASSSASASISATRSFTSRTTRSGQSRAGRSLASLNREDGLFKISRTTRRAYAGCACSSAANQPRRKRTAYIALGSNLGDRVAEIEEACRQMDARGVRVKRTSSLWETEPMYVVDQDRFLNGACEVETDLEPLELLDVLQGIEKDMGRKKVIDKGPRNIDLDILLYEGEKVDHKRLTIPHPGIKEREFVLRPLAELIPSHPLDANKPWTLIQDHLNDLPIAEPLSSFTPISESLSLTPLSPRRQTHIMSILNLTPDSFSDGGDHQSTSLQTILDVILSSGASIVDIGGQSTAPGREEVSAEEELSRVLPAIEQLRSSPPGRAITISVDTYRASVAEKAIAAGADMINDVSAGTLDPDMLPTVARLGKTICLMHMRGNPRTMNDLTAYPDGLIPTVATELLERVAAAEAAGIRRWRIVLDPGIGFAKSYDQNLELLRDAAELKRWPGLEGLPWLVGTSRKGFVGKATGVKEPRERDWGTAATVAAAVQGGADVVRVHDGREMGLVAKMSDAIWRS